MEQQQYIIFKSLRLSCQYNETLSLSCLDEKVHSLLDDELIHAARQRERENRR